MQQIKILIVEDDIIIAEKLQFQLEDFGYSITAKCRNSLEAIQSFQEDEPDLLILDISLEGSPKDGIEIAEELNKIQRKPIIYLTSYTDKLTLDRAQKTKPSYFLVKPSSKRQIRIAIDFAIANFATNTPANPDPTFVSDKKIAESESIFLNNNFFFVRHKNQYVRINTDDILWVEADGPGVKIYTVDSKAMTYANLSSFERQIKHPDLIRIHRSYVVNKDKVVALKEGDVHIPYKNKIKEIPIGGMKYRDALKEHFPLLKSD